MSDSGSKLDPRIVRSKAALRDALLHLMSQRSFASISITDIVKQAKYNRGTFYANYANKEALLDDVISELLKDLVQAFRAPYEHASSFHISELHANSVKIFEHVHKNAHLYSLLTRSDALPVLREKMFASLKDLVRHEFVHEDPDIDPELSAIYSNHALIGLLFHWIESGYVHPASYMQEQLMKIVTRRPTRIKTAPNRNREKPAP
ncbi:TetR/AcrR family transcriptional regulator [Paenibacillus antri]|uniref:TetR/AcrR family transcriptional regulator n=1 Tax=Paenibacillus antri TaxID=2582848 RepID=A0A5R9G011_9BACL|nr:TetR/AcrR family transcriptional regulator [Paenibacillus antri]TLS49101.1 TetR/AcrR family transcriptional regulator [Paenibacillus antri]